MHLLSIIASVLLGWTLCPPSTLGAYLRGYFPRQAYGLSSSKALTFSDVLFKSKPRNWLRDYIQRQNNADVDEQIDCMAATGYYHDIGYAPGILTERGNGVCPKYLDSSYYLEECDTFDCSPVCDAVFSVKVLAEKVREDGCIVVEVNIRIVGPISGCYVALVNGVLQISCPPDELPEEYRKFFLHPVYWEDAPKYQTAGNTLGEAGYIICAERTAEPCQREARMLIANMENIQMTTHILPIVYA